MKGQALSLFENILFLFYKPYRPPSLFSIFRIVFIRIKPYNSKLYKEIVAENLFYYNC